MKKYNTMTFVLKNYIKKAYPTEMDLNEARNDMMYDINDMTRILLRNGNQIQTYDDDGSGEVIVMNYGPRDLEYGIELVWVNSEEEYIERYDNDGDNEIDVSSVEKEFDETFVAPNEEFWKE